MTDDNAPKDATEALPLSDRDTPDEPAGTIPLSDEGERWMVSAKHRRLQKQADAEGWTGTLSEYIRHLDKKAGLG